MAVGDRVYVKINVRNQLNYKLGPKFEVPFSVVKAKKGNRFVVLDENTGVSRLTYSIYLKLKRRVNGNRMG